MSDSLKKWDEIKYIVNYGNINPYLTELNELRKENDLQKEVISELNNTVRDLRESIYIQETLSKNNTQDNNTRLQGLIDEVFGLLNEYDEYSLVRNQTSPKRLDLEKQIEIRLKIINTLK